MPRPKYKGIPRGLDEIDISLKARLTEYTKHIRSEIANALETGHLEDARQMILNFYWLKFGPHKLFLIEHSLNMTNTGKLERVVGVLMNPKSAKLSLESETES